MKQVRRKQITYDFNYTWNLKETKKRNKQKTGPLNTKNKLVVTKGEACGGLGKIHKGE